MNAINARCLDPACFWSSVNMPLEDTYEVSFLSEENISD